MKAKHIVVYLLLAIVSSSCIREEALNAEADGLTRLQYILRHQ